MKLDFVAKQKNTITVSGSIAGTMAGLTDIHTVKTSFVWAAPILPSAYATVTLNIYELERVDTIDLSYTGELNTILIERSIDGFTWETLSTAFAPSDTTLEIDYTSDDFRDFKMIRMTIDAPDSFVLTDWKVNREIVYENTHLISHNIFNLYSPKEIDKFPVYPDFHKQILRMLEGNNNLDLKLFDATIFTATTISSGVVSDALTLTPVNVPLISDTLYIWDFDDTTSGSANNIIVSQNPTLAQTHTYNNTGLFVPRLLIQTRTYMIEVATSFTKA